MSFKYGVLSLLVFCISLLLFLKDYKVWTQPIELVPQNEAGKAPREDLKAASAIVLQKEPNPAQFHTLIAEKNIFSPERKDFPNPSSQHVNTRVRPQIILYGVTIAGDVQLATVVSPGRPLKKGEREAMSLKAGERIGDYKLASILPDRVILEGGEDKFEVLISDPKKPKQRDEIRTAVSPAAVVSSQPIQSPAVQERPVTVPPKEAVQETRQPSVRMSDVPVAAPSKQMADIPVSTPKMPDVSRSVPMQITY